MHDTVVLGASYLWMPDCVARDVYENGLKDEFHDGVQYNIYWDTDKIRVVGGEYETIYSGGIVTGPLEAEVADAIVKNWEVAHFVKAVDALTAPCRRTGIDRMGRETFSSPRWVEVHVHGDEIHEGGCRARVSTYVTVSSFFGTKPAIPREKWVFPMFEALDKRFGHKIECIRLKDVKEDE